jgi:hypothetical protein
VGWVIDKIISLIFPKRHEAITASKLACEDLERTLDILREERFELRKARNHNMSNWTERK